MKTLYLPIKQIYFDEIKAGTKLDEYRLVTPFWSKRLVGKHYDRVEITLGYPSATDSDRRLNFPYRGVRKMKLTHPHFGPDEVEVYAIALEQSGGVDTKLEVKL